MAISSASQTGTSVGGERFAPPSTIWGGIRLMKASGDLRGLIQTQRPMRKRIDTHLLKPPHPMKQVDHDSNSGRPSRVFEAIVGH